MQVPPHPFGATLPNAARESSHNVEASVGLGRGEEKISERRELLLLKEETGETSNPTAAMKPFIRQ